MKIRLASKDILTDSIVDGEGLRADIWTQGCAHHCKGCHNPETHDFHAGYLVDTEDIKKSLDTLCFQDGITFSGGDPFYQVDAVLDIAKHAKGLGFSIWCYTGFVIEDLLVNEKCLELLRYIDVLVDGEFELEHRSLTLKFRGSTNQRIIHVPRTLKSGKVSLIRKYDMMDKPLKSSLFI